MATRYDVNGKAPLAAWVPTRTQTADDVIGSRDGTLQNGAAVIADAGAGGSHAFSLDGASHFISFGTGFATFSDSLAFSGFCWGKTTKTGTGIIFSKWPRLVAPGWMLWHIGGELNFALLLSGATARRRTTAGIGLNNGQWRQLGFSYDGSSDAAGIKIYVDGEIVPSTASSNVAPGALTDTDFRIGITSGTVSSSEYFAGLIDDVRLFDVATDADDAAYLWGGGEGRGRVTGRNMAMMRRRRTAAGGLL